MSFLARAKRQGLGAVVATLATMAALAAVALAFVTIYSNSFGSKNAYREVSNAGGGGGACERSWNKKNKAMRVVVDRGPRTCNYIPPVQGDGPQPDHRFDAGGRILQSTTGNVREEAYLAIALRVGGGDHYQLRVFPQSATFELRRQPAAVGFPVTGTDPAIGEVGERNVLRLLAEGNRIRAFVNDVQVADVIDANPGELNGEKVEFGVGSEADSRRDTVGNIDKLKLAVPDP